MSRPGKLALPKRISVFIVLTLCLSACEIAQSLGIVVPAPTPVVEYQVHVVKAGETLSLIAARYRATVERIIALNMEEYPVLARDPSVLQVGWQLRVPKIAINAPGTPTVQPKADLFETAQLIAEQINATRAQRGMALLRLNATLTHIAGDRSRDMIGRGYFSHQDPETSQEPLLRYLQATKFQYQYAGENIAEIRNDANWVPGILTVAARYDSSELAQKFVEDWLKSPEHRENILQQRYRRTGVGLAVSEDGKRIVVTQAFAD